jgi:hypothetical protein
VKITVIATGFKDSDQRRRRMDAQSTFVVSRSDDFFEPTPEPESDPLPPPPMVMQEAAPVAVPSREPVGIDAMRDAMIANFEQADLDVPAFLRKRSETM